MKTYEITSTFPAKTEGIDPLVAVYASMVDNAYLKIKADDLPLSETEIRFYFEDSEVKCQLIVNS